MLRLQCSRVDVQWRLAGCMRAASSAVTGTTLRLSTAGRTRVEPLWQGRRRRRRKRRDYLRRALELLRSVPEPQPLQRGQELHPNSTALFFFSTCSLGPLEKPLSAILFVNRFQDVLWYLNGTFVVAFRAT